ncbi:hypothetical protein DUNSADRAFT_12849 [Dunaliella salina]|uniref:Uncharacterized protein n=1 Tax=Dunaliella salina TaxID=3046 RepID=A0ABQ7H9Q5_DUNSA|nr:hypothetical protein DUNSADRAFT_12849 [Dunaliella salina]|eukprot:KAF5843587.1 hypothetical protein DUNSADRAFT_12849 [Dunaliella salina]
MDMHLNVIYVFQNNSRMKATSSFSALATSCVVLEEKTPTAVERTVLPMEMFFLPNGSNIVYGDPSASTIDHFDTWRLMTIVEGTRVTYNAIISVKEELFGPDVECGNNELAKEDLRAHFSAIRKEMDVETFSAKLSSFFAFRNVSVTDLEGPTVIQSINPNAKLPKSRADESVDFGLTFKTETVDGAKALSQRAGNVEDYLNEVVLPDKFKGYGAYVSNLQGSFANGMTMESGGQGMEAVARFSGSLYAATITDDLRQLVQKNMDDGDGINLEDVNSWSKKIGITVTSAGTTTDATTDRNLGNQIHVSYQIVAFLYILLGLILV